MNFDGHPDPTAAIARHYIASGTHYQETEMAQDATPGWYADPTKSYIYRYWDGSAWTNQVSTGGSSATDPNPMDAQAATTPPAPGTEAPAPPTQAPQPAVQVTQKSGGSFLGAVVGVILLVVIGLVFVAILSDSSDSPPTTGAPAETVTTVAPTTTAAP
jgi:hypothetical protein